MPLGHSPPPPRGSLIVMELKVYKVSISRFICNVETNISIPDVQLGSVDIAPPPAYFKLQTLFPGLLVSR